MKKTIIILLFISLLSCQEKDNDAPNNFDRKELVTNITNNLIVPNIISFENEVKSLNNLIINYGNDLTEQNLANIKNQWKKAAKAYANIYVFNIGEVKNDFTHQALYNWPTLGIAIENFIRDRQITKETVANFSPQAKTLSGLGYLLFNNSTSEVNLNFKNSAKRLNYLRFISSELEERASMLAKKWNEKYATTFINNEESGIKSSYNMLYNGVYNTISTIKVSKLGKPAGLENSSNTSPNEIQAQYSKLSVSLMIENLKSIEKVLFNESGVDFSDNIKFITKNDELNTKLKTSIINSINSLEKINTPLYEAVETEKEVIKNAYEALKSLDILLGVDVKSTLSIIITATDNDGD